MLSFHKALLGLRLSTGNSLSGTLPAAWSGLRQLQELSLKDNLLTGPVPWEWADPSGMSSLRCAFARVKGERLVRTADARKHMPVI